MKRKAAIRDGGRYPFGFMAKRDKRVIKETENDTVRGRGRETSPSGRQKAAANHKKNRKPLETIESADRTLPPLAGITLIGCRVPPRDTWGV
jgi:hypothetical protein